MPRGNQADGGSTRGKVGASGQWRAPAVVLQLARAKDDAHIPDDVRSQRRHLASARALTMAELVEATVGACSLQA